MRRLRVAAVQVVSENGWPETNLENAERFVAEAAGAGAERKDLESVPWYGMHPRLQMSETRPRPSPPRLTCGPLAKAAGAGVETLRIHERRGVIEEADCPFLDELGGDHRALQDD